MRVDHEQSLNPCLKIGPESVKDCVTDFKGLSSLKSGVDEILIYEKQLLNICVVEGSPL